MLICTKVLHDGPASSREPTGCHSHAQVEPQLQGRHNKLPCGESSQQPALSAAACPHAAARIQERGGAVKPGTSDSSHSKQNCHKVSTGMFSGFKDVCVAASALFQSTTAGSWNINCIPHRTLAVTRLLYSHFARPMSPLNVLSGYAESACSAFCLV